MSKLKISDQRAPVLVTILFIGSFGVILHQINEARTRVTKARDMCYSELKRRQTELAVVEEEQDDLEEAALLTPKRDELETAPSVPESDFDDNDELPEVLIITNATMKQPDMDWMHPGTQSFDRCPNLEPWMKCTYNPNPKEVWDQAEGVIFHGRHITKDHPVPSYRPPRQKWIFYESEPPPRVWDRVKVLNEVWTQFNFSSTYMDNSDLPYSYYKLVCDDVENWKPSGVNWAQNKTKSTAWWVSHCKCDTRREKYVKEMKKYINIEVMGSCGSPTCGSYVEGPKCVSDLLDREFKFYLAFENSFCKEYYTEKLSKCLPINVIPVLMGLQDYTEFLPKGSYIDVRHFKGPKDLSNYLNYLDKNDNAYNAYIERKRSFKCVNRDSLSYPCKLCRYLHENRNKRQMAPDARVTFGSAAHCISPKKFFKGIAEGIYDKLDTPKVFEESGADMEWSDEKIIV